MKSPKILLFVLLLAPSLSRVEASPINFQQTVFVAEKQQVSGFDNSSETGVFSPININKQRINNNKGTFLIAGKKRFPGAIGTRGQTIFVPQAVNVQREAGGTGVAGIFVSKTVLENVTTAGDSFLLDFAKNDNFNQPFTSPELSTIATDTNNILAANFQTTTAPITVTFQGDTQSFGNDLNAANTRMSQLITQTGLTQGPVSLNIYGVNVEYVILP